MKTPGSQLSLMEHTKLDSSWVDYMLLYFSVASLLNYMTSIPTSLVRTQATNNSSWTFSHPISVPQVCDSASHWLSLSPRERTDILTSLSSTHLLFHPFVSPSFKCHYINLQQGISDFPESNSNPTAYKHAIFRDDLSSTPISESISQARTKAWMSYYLSTFRKYWPRFLLLPCLV